MFETIVYILIGWYIGHQISKKYRDRQEDTEDRRSMKESIDELNEKLENMIVPLHVRTESGIFYAYHAEDEVFVAQGTDLDMLRINFEANLPKKHGVIVSSDADSLPHVTEYLKRTTGKSITWREAND